MNLYFDQNGPLSYRYNLEHIATYAGKRSNRLHLSVQLSLRNKKKNQLHNVSDYKY